MFPSARLNFSDSEVPTYVLTDGACESADDGSYSAFVGGKRDSILEEGLKVLCLILSSRVKVYY